MRAHQLQQAQRTASIVTTLPSQAKALEIEMRSISSAFAFFRQVPRRYGAEQMGQAGYAPACIRPWR
jgi:hypothetical protein